MRNTGFLFIFKLIYFVILLLILNCVNQINAFSVKSVKKLSNNGNELKDATTAKVPVQTSVEYEDLSTNAETSHTSSLLKKCDPCPGDIICVPQIQCPAHVRMADHEKPQICDLPGGDFGFCCVTGQNHTAARMDIERFHHDVSILPMNVIEQARLEFEKLMHHIASLPVLPGQPDFLHNMVFHSSQHEDMQNFQLTNSAMEQVVTTQVFIKKEQIPVDDIITNNIQIKFNETPLNHHCKPPHKCHSTKSIYRTFDGTCNNAQKHRTHWGAAGQPMERLLPPAYEDGIWEPRLHGSDGKPLPSAREVSRQLLTDVHRPHPKHNMLLMQFGQFLAHDISQSSSVKLENGESPQCCAKDGVAILPADKRHFACMPISIEANDEFYSDFKVRCQNFVRLSLAPSTNCKMSYGKQRSKVTHYLDASPVYGSSLETARELRTFRGGKLRMLNDFGREMLPLTDDKKACESTEQGRSCFKSGDGRTNQIITLVCMHLLFAREHNRIAEILWQLNPNYSDEKLFQEARRIVIAEFQHIIYNEYLPAVIGPIQMQRFRLQTQHHGYASDYNPDVNAAITNEFSGAAFRMGHSSVDGRLHMREKNARFAEIVEIPDVMFNPSRIRQRNYHDDMLQMLLSQPMQEVDSSVTHGLSRYLFRGHNPFGLDLAAFNVQRGRDQGLHCYNDYLEVMGHRKLQSFSDLPTQIGKKLSKIYRSPNDIDLWIGGLLEKPIEGGIVGSTFAEIIADQFSRFKHGDRYYYEYGQDINPGAFELQQLHQIRKASMARLICDNADGFTLSEVPPAAFVRADFPGNHPIQCDSPHLPTVDLGAWRQRF